MVRFKAVLVRREYYDVEFDAENYEEAQRVAWEHCPNKPTEVQGDIYDLEEIK